MEKQKVTTRLAAPLRRRLKVYAAATGLTVEDVVSTALDSYLSAASADAATDSPDLVRPLAETSAAPAR